MRGFKDEAGNALQSFRVKWRHGPAMTKQCHTCISKLEIKNEKVHAQRSNEDGLEDIVGDCALCDFEGRDEVNAII